MKYLLVTLFVFSLSMLSVQPAAGISPVAEDAPADTTGTGGTVSRMEWDESPELTAVETLQAPVDSAQVYSLSGQRVKSDAVGILVKNGKCLVIVK